MKVQELMTAGCRTCSREDSLREAAKTMAADGVGILPIADDDRMVGMLTDRDIVTRAVAEGRDIDQSKAGDFMSDEVLYCFEDQDTDEVADSMGKLQVRRLPVVNRDKKLVGMISLGDLSNRGATEAAGVALSEVSAPR